MAGLLALGAPGCLAAPSPPRAAAPQRPAIAPSPASVHGRLKLALVGAWLWMDGAYVGRLERLDYVRLLARVRARRAAAGDSAEARTVELEVDANTDWRSAHYVLGLCDDYERVELITAAHRFSLRVEAQGPDATPESASNRRTVVFVRSEGVAVWAGQEAPHDAPLAIEAEPEKLLELPLNDLQRELDAELRRVCSTGSRCARVVVYFEEGVHGHELVRVLESLEHAPGSGATPPVVSLALPLPPLPGCSATPALAACRSW
jgi:hypothetical protein